MNRIRFETIQPIALNFRVINWLKYWLYGKTIYRLHSPFVYEFAEAVIRDDRIFYAFERIERRRRDLLHDQRAIDMVDFGAGSTAKDHSSRTIADITRTSSVNEKYGRLLFRTVQYFRPGNVLELGSCTGIGSMYLAGAMHHGRLVTLEGDPVLADTARESLKFLGNQSTETAVLTGPFEENLSQAMEMMPSIDLAYIDGNHRKAPTLEYFEALQPKCHEASIIIIDDIYWSTEMGEAWEAVKNHPRTRLTIDLFRMGLVFFREENLEVEHFKLYY